MRLSESLSLKKYICSEKGRFRWDGKSTATTFSPDRRYSKNFNGDVWCVECRLDDVLISTPTQEVSILSIVSTRFFWPERWIFEFFNFPLSSFLIFSGPPIISKVYCFRRESLKASIKKSIPLVPSNLKRFPTKMTLLEIFSLFLFVKKSPS